MLIYKEIISGSSLCPQNVEVGLFLRKWEDQDFILKLLSHLVI